MQINGFRENGTQGNDISAYISDDNIRKVKAVTGMIKGAMMAGICGFAFFSPMFRAMQNTGDDVMVTSAHGFKLLLILLMVIGVIMALRNLLMLILQLTGNDETEFGRRYTLIMGAMEVNAGRLVQIVMGSLFVIFAGFAFIQGPDKLAEGSTVEGLYIVSGIFVLAGAGVAIGGIIGIIKSIKYYLSGEGIQ